MMQCGTPVAITSYMNALQIPAYTMTELTELETIPRKGCWLLSSDHAEVIGRFGSDGNFVTAAPRAPLIRGEHTLRLMEEPTHLLPAEASLVVSTPAEPKLLSSLWAILATVLSSSSLARLYMSLTLGAVSCLKPRRLVLIVKERSLRSATVLCQKHAGLSLVLSFLLGAVFF